MNSQQIKTQLSTAHTLRAEAGTAYELAASRLSQEESQDMDDGRPVNQLTEGQARFLLAVRNHNASLDRLEDLEAELKMALACEEFEAGGALAN